MAQLTFRSILDSGSISLGEGTIGGPDPFNRLISNISLNRSAEDFGKPALLVLMTRNVDEGMSFLTWNAPDNVANRSFDQVKDEEYFISRVLENPDPSGWVPQVHKVPAGVLNTGSDNRLGIHSRTASGGNSGNHENSNVARIFLLYFGFQT